MMQWQEKPNGLVVHTPMWDAPKHVKSVITSRIGGSSSAPFNGLNLGTHVGDDPQTVHQNRALITALLPTQPLWLNQVHGTTIWTKNVSIPSLQADGAITADRNDVLCILSADCLPILFTDQAGDIIAVRFESFPVAATTVTPLVFSVATSSARPAGTAQPAKIFP